MKTLLWLLIGGPVAVIVIALAVVNNQPVTIALDPFTPQTPWFAFTIPLYAVFFVALMAGIILGGIGTWTKQGRFRKAARQNRREAARWRVEAEQLKGAAVTGPSGTALPAPASRRAA